MPDPPEGDKSKRPGRQRGEVLEEHGIEPELPEVHSAYLADYFFQAGPALPGFNGAEPLTSTELLNWQQGEGVALAPWEFRLIRQLSRAYVGELRRATKRGCPAPWKPEQHSIADQLDTSDRLEEAMERAIDL